MKTPDVIRRIVKKRNKGSGQRLKSTRRSSVVHSDFVLNATFAE
jgi:hypothetical protein